MSNQENTMYYLEIVTPDVESACEFYTINHGWSFRPMDPALGNARVATIPDGSLCGIRAPMHDAESPIVRTYLRVTNIQDAYQKALQTGAADMLGPTELPGHGTVAIFGIGGVEQGIWQLP